MPPPPLTNDLLARRKSSIALDLKAAGATALLKSLLKHVDVLIEPFRHGTLEKLRLDPKELLSLNPRLVIARMSGFRNYEKYGSMAGHDINYLAVSGVLSQLGRSSELPYAPANILADFAGGGLMCAFGIVMALLNRATNGKGQIVEINMVDGSAYLASFMRYSLKTPLWSSPRGENVLDGGCPWYDVYECKDGGHMAVGALETNFFEELLLGLGIDREVSDKRNDRRIWPDLRKQFQHEFKQKTRQEWETVFNSKDACCTPVLGQNELENMDYEQRLPVGLLGTPGLRLSQNDGWNGTALAPGAGGEDLLKAWAGWKRGRDFDVVRGGLEKTNSAKL